MSSTRTTAVRKQPSGGVGALAARSDRWYCTQRFRRDFRSASGPLQHLVRQELRHLKAERRERRGLLIHDTVAGVGSKNVRELEIGRGWRLLYHVEGHELTLLRLGDHGEVGRFQSSWTAASMRRNLADRELLDSADLVSGGSRLFPPTQSRRPSRLTRFGAEVAPHWLYFLDVQQARAFDEMVESVESVLVDEGHYCVDFLVGGPGTGKTSVLLQCLVHFTDQVVAGSETWSVGLHVSDRLAEQIEEATGWALDPVREAGRQALFEGAPLDLLLVDDPEGLGFLRYCVALAEQGPVKAVVVAMDPLQLRESLTDQEFEGLAADHGATTHLLDVCYRQKEQVGELASRVAQAVASSSPFLDARKKQTFSQDRQRLTALANRMRYSNPSGHTQTYVPAKHADWNEHLGWIVAQGAGSRPWERLAVIVEEGITVPDSWYQGIRLRNLNYQEVALANVEQVKGLEFAHVMLFLTDDTYQNAVNGFTGKGQRGYANYRLMRIPFSRARDSLTVWVV